MSGREMQFGVRITADGRVLIDEFKRADQEVEKFGKKVKQSSGEAAQAMRMLPAQMTDIAVGLSTGQSPFMVLMQQGGQLKDMFGGIGPAIRAVGGYVASMINPVTLAAGAVVGLGAAYVVGQREAQALSKSIILTNNAAATSVGQLQSLSMAIAANSGATRGAVAGVLTDLVSTGRVAEETLASVASAAVALERAGVQAIDDTVRQMAELGKSPVEASLKLNEQYRYLTDAIYQQIKALEDQGRTDEAAAAAQKAYADAMAERAKDIQGNLGALERSWNGITAAATSAFDAMLGIGRQASPAEKIAEAQKAVEDLRSRIETMQAAGSGDSLWAGLQRRRLVAAEATLAALKTETAEQERNTAAKAAANAQEQARIRWSVEGEKYLSRAAQMEREIAQARTSGAAAGAKTAEIEQRIAAIREKYANKSTKADRGIEDMATVQAKQYADLYAAAAKYADGLNLQLDAGRKLTQGEQILAQAKAKLTDAQYAEVEAIISGVEARAEAAQADEDAAKATEAYFGPLEAKLKSMQEELDTYGMSESAIQKSIVARLEEARAIAAANGAFPEHLAFLDREIELRKQMAGAAASKEALDANKNASDDLAQNMERAAQDVNRSLADAIMRGGQSGADYIKNLFRTLVLTPMVQAITQPIASAVTSSLYGGSSGNPLTSIGNAAALYAGGGAIANYAGQGLISISNATGLQGVGDYGANLISGTNTLPLGGIITAYSKGGLSGFMSGVGSTALAGGVSGVISGSGFLSGASGALGSLGPWGWAALAAAAILGGLDSGGGPKTEGGWSYRIDNGQVVDNGTAEMYSDGRRNNAGHSANSSIQSALKPVVEGAQSLVQSLGGNADGLQFQLQFNSDPQGDAPDMVASAIRDKDGNVVYQHANNNVERGKSEQELTTEVKRLMLGAIKAADVDPVYKGLVNSIDLATASVEQLDQALTDVGNMQTVMSFGASDPFKDYADSMDNASLTTMGALARQRTAITAAAAAYDGSSASIAKLSALTQERYQLELKLAAELAAAAKATKDSFAASRREIELAGLTDAQKYNYYDAEAAKYYQQLQAATDPAAIQRLAEQGRQSMMDGYNLLSEDQKLAKKAEYLAKLDDLDSLAEDRYAAVPAAVKEENAALTKEIGNSIETHMAKAAAATATTLQAAIPTEIKIKIETPVASQVGGWGTA